MTLYLSEDKMKKLRKGCFEEEIFATHAILRDHHSGEPVIERKVLATFPSSAIVADGSGAVYRYWIQEIDGRRQVTARHPIEWAELMSEAEIPQEQARAVLEGRKIPPIADDPTALVWERIADGLARSSFLQWCKENSPLIEAQLWDSKPAHPALVDTNWLKEGLRKRQLAGGAPAFRPEWDYIAFWASKLPSNFAETTRSGETLAALVEYIKKIDTFTHLKFGPTDP